MENKRAPVIAVIKENCVNCHKCISVCPVKYCIDGAGDKVSINHDLCIGCGHCIDVCDHEARSWEDDFSSFMEYSRKGGKSIAIVAPAVAASFPETWQHLLGYLKTLGVDAFFDVSLGAELTVRSYLEYIRTHQPRTLIAQPCPAIVSFIELYQPDLIPYLAPADSPMVHTMKMIRTNWPAYKNRKILALSPCLAKKREFDETRYGDFNVTFRSLQDWIEERKIPLKKYRQEEFTGPPAERAVRFSTPGGLMLTADRDAPGIAYETRKIEGASVYEYLKNLPEGIDQNYAPGLIDCLNCENGCNGGPGTYHQKSSYDLLSHRVEHRVFHASKQDKRAGKRVNKRIEAYWDPELYKREYKDLSGAVTIQKPSSGELDAIYEAMQKTKQEDFLNCASCGYGSCEGMATAIHNRLNKAENCHHYRQIIISRERDTVTDLYGTLHEKINNCKSLIQQMNQAVGKVTGSVEAQSSSLEQSSAAIEEMVRSLGNLSRISQSRQQALSELDGSVRTGEKDLAQTVHSIHEITQSVKGIGDLLSLISGVADQTSLLSMNAAIEAAHAGDSGKGFAVVAGEIRKLADTTEKNVKDVGDLIGDIRSKAEQTSEISGKTGRNIGLVLSEMQNLTAALQEFLNYTEEMSAGNKQVNLALSDLKGSSQDVLGASCFMTDIIQGLEERLQEILVLSDSNMEQIQKISGKE